MPRVAWFSPMPPARTGVAVYSAEVVAALSRDHTIDVYPQERAHDFLWTHLKQPYDLIVYQLGNSTLHEYIWPYLYRYPGLVVLHDARLHHARAAALLSREKRDEYRREFAASHPDTTPGAAELAIAGFDNHLYYSWGMTALVVESSRATGVHSPVVAEQLRERHPSALIGHIHLSHGEVVTPEREREARSRVRSRLGIRDETVVFGLFGGLTPEKRVPQALAALASTLPYRSDVRLLLAGSAAAHYDVEADIKKHGVAGAVDLVGYVNSDDEFTDHLLACDVSLNLRWPTAQEISGPWLRALAAGRPTITIDLVHMAHVPSLDPRTWTVSALPTKDGSAPVPVMVAIDILDEDHSLRLAMRRLAEDADLRARLGAAARAHWLKEHSKDLMVGDYRRLMERAMRAKPRPDVIAEQPAHLRDVADGKLEKLLEPFGVPAPWSKL